jgi:hypothetical protein
MDIPIMAIIYRKKCTYLTPHFVSLLKVRIIHFDGHTESFEKYVQFTSMDEHTNDGIDSKYNLNG